MPNEAGTPHTETEQTGKGVLRGLTPTQKNRLVIGGFAVAVIAVLAAAAIVQNLMKGPPPPPTQRIDVPKERALLADPVATGLVEEGKGLSVAQELMNVKAENSALKDQQAKVTPATHPTGASADSPREGKPEPTPPAELARQFKDGVKNGGYPEGAITADQFRHELATPGKPAPPPEPEWAGEWLGVAAEPASSPGGEKKERKIILQRGAWTKGQVIGGAYAPTAAKGLSEAKPVIIRVEAEAVLPSDQREDWIEGCSIIGAANGEHGIHRGAIWLTGISCTSTDKKHYISEDITGWVVGPDGREGIQGEVVSYYHETIGYLAIAEGAKATGEILKAQATTTTLTPLGGTQQTLTGEKLGQTMGGAGVAGMFGSMSDIYSSLTKEQMPYVDISPGMEVTLFLKKDVELEIKTRCGEEDGCGNEKF